MWLSAYTFGIAVITELKLYGRDEVWSFEKKILPGQCKKKANFAFVAEVVDRWNFNLLIEFNFSNCLNPIGTVVYPETSSVQRPMAIY